MKYLSIIFSIVVCFFAGSVRAQESTAPHIAYIYPAGGAAGSEFTMIFGGVKFADVERIVFLFGGAKSEIRRVMVPLTDGQRAQITHKCEREYILNHSGTKERVEALGKEGQSYLTRAVRDVPEFLERINDAQVSYYLRWLSSDALAETVEVKVSLPPDIRAGVYSVMLSGKNGISNPAKFEVGTLPETSKNSLRFVAEERARSEKYWGRSWALMNRGVFVEPFNNEPIEVALPAVVNGQIVEGNTDFWRFSAKKGSRIVMSISAQSLLPYISDAVPGWFQTALRVRDSSGREVAFNDDFRHRPDSFLVFDVPADGEYIAEVFDAVHRGREDFVYRMTMGEIPFAESVFPLAVAEGEDTKVQVVGDNLKSDKFVVSPKRSGAFEFDATFESGMFHRAIPMLAVRNAPVLSASESARSRGEDSGSASAELKIPSVANGRIYKAGDVDIYRFELVHGKKIVAEIFARRLDSPLDSYITISDSSGKILARADDFEDLSYGLTTHHADSRLEFTAPATGTYFLRVRDAAGKGSASHSYVLKLSYGAPDFAVRASPSTLNMRAGGSAAVSLKAFRKNGMDSDISVIPTNLPKGWKYSGGIIKKGSDTGELVITAPEKFGGIVSFGAVANAKVGKREIRRAAVPCEDMMQAFYYRHFVPFKTFYAKAGNDAGILRQFRRMKLVSSPEPQKFVLGEKTLVRIGDFNFGAVGKLLPSVFGTSKITPLRFHCDKNRFYLVAVADPKNAKIGDVGEMSVGIDFRAGRKVFSVDRVPSIKFEIVGKGQATATPKPDAQKKTQPATAKKSPADSPKPKPPKAPKAAPRTSQIRR